MLLQKEFIQDKKEFSIPIHSSVFRSVIHDKHAIRLHSECPVCNSLLRRYNPCSIPHCSCEFRCYLCLGEDPSVFLLQSAPHVRREDKRQGQLDSAGGWASLREHCVLGFAEQTDVLWASNSCKTIQ